MALFIIRFSPPEKQRSDEKSVKVYFKISFSFLANACSYAVSTT
jgi:hypothetical protein